MTSEANIAAVLQFRTPEDPGRQTSVSKISKKTVSHVGRFRYVEQFCSVAIGNADIHTGDVNHNEKRTGDIVRVCDERRTAACQSCETSKKMAGMC